MLASLALRNRIWHNRTSRSHGPKIPDSSIPKNPFYFSHPQAEDYWIVAAAGFGTVAGMIAGTLENGSDVPLVHSVQCGTLYALGGCLCGTLAGWICFHAWPLAIVPVLSIGLGTSHRIITGRYSLPYPVRSSPGPPCIGCGTEIKD